VNEQQLTEELGRAYRCIVGFYTAHFRGESLDRTALVYQCTVIGAAQRFVFDGELDGSNYFEGKSLDVLRDALKEHAL
jgi:hypothetical protein